MDRFLQPFIRRVTLQEFDDLPAQEEIETAEKMPYVPVKLEKEVVMRNSKDPDAPDVAGIHKVNGMTPLLGMNYPDYMDSLCNGRNGSTCDVLLCVAMYNEGVHEFNATMTGVAQNLRYFTRYGVPQSKVTCVIIVDGPKAFLSEIKKRESSMDNKKSVFRSFFDEEIIKETFGQPSIDKCHFEGQEEYDEFSHNFVHTMEFQGVEGYPLQVIFCIKQFNKRKLNTHLWFFGGFCEMIQPKYVMLLDVGTAPEKKALFYLYEAMETDINVAGCCGEIAPDADSCWNPVVMAQAVEYKFAHIFDKALESVMGYITVLPGAFSAYRWDALCGKPLWKDYFKSLCHPEEMDCFNSNIYLAEDRVLCMALVSKAKEKYRLRYVKKSVAKTDVPESLGVLMAQRRRWINGSWFALIKSLKDFRRIGKSGHGCGRKCLLYSEMIYYYINVMIAWLMVGSFFLVFAIAVRTEFDYDSDADFSAIGNYIVSTYLLLLIVVFILSLSVKPKRVENIYKGVGVIMGVFMLFTLYLMVALMFDDSVGGYTVFMVLATMMAFLLNMAVNCAVVTVAKGIFQFLYLTPTYINVFLIYSICNIHDCTWGNRPDALTAEEKNRIEEFEHFRSRWVLIWAVCNSAFAYALNSMEKESDGSLIYLTMIAIIGGVLLLIRTVFGILYVIQELCCKAKLQKKDTEDNSQNGRNNNINNNGNYARILNDALEHSNRNELAQKIGISPERIQMIQNGDDRPSNEEVIAINAAILNI